MKTKLFLLAVIFILATSCNKNENNEQETNTISFTNIGKGGLYGNGTEGISQSNLVITNSTDWDNLISQMNSVNNVTNLFTETSIDFDNFMLIAVILDVKNNGWSVEINDIMENSSEIIISTQETEYVTLEIMQPFHIVKIPNSIKPIIFQ